MTSRPLIIALVGAKRCGKDTVAEMLSQYGYENWKIAGRLKKVCKDMFGFSDTELETNIKDEPHAKWGVSPRYIMQVLGTEIVQVQLKQFIPSITKTFWVERLCEDIQNEESVKCIVVSDLRFVHECDYLRNVFKNKLLIVKIVRDSLEMSDPHISEQEWQKVKEDVCLCNNSTLKHLEKLVSNLIK